MEDPIKDRIPGIHIATVTADVVVKGSSEQLSEILKEAAHDFDVNIDEIANIPTISALREGYRACGKNPTRYRGSAEALYRRIMQGKGLYYVNNIVDINNLVSVKSGLSVGSYDTEKIAGITVSIGRAGEAYQGIGKEDINLEGLPVFRDENGPFGSPTSDSRRAMITDSTRKIAMLLISFGGLDSNKIDEFAHLAGSLLGQYSEGRNVSIEHYTIR